MRRRVFLARGLLMTSAAAALISLLESCAVTVEETTVEAKTGKAACAARGKASEAFFHTHPVKCVTVEALEQGGGVTLSLITGLTHQVSLSPSQLSDLTQGRPVETRSSWTLFHTHLVTFRRV